MKKEIHKFELANKLRADRYNSLDSCLQFSKYCSLSLLLYLFYWFLTYIAS